MAYVDEIGLAKTSDVLKTYIDDKVNVPQQIATASDMDSLLIAENVGKVYIYTGTTNVSYTQGDIYIVEVV